jgi:polyprenyl P-hydroxybenzoate/phenylacrylic acid decarboxylase-like protein
MKRRIIVGISGASGVGYGIELLRALGEADIESHLVISRWATQVIAEETELNAHEVHQLAGAVHHNDNLAAPISSSSFQVDGMVVIPASVKTVAEIANAHSATLIARAADNMLKLRRRLVVCIRETPLSGPCLENLTRLAGYGAVVMPLSPGFYHHPATVQDLHDFITGKVLDALGIDNERYRRWAGAG